MKPGHRLSFKNSNNAEILIFTETEKKKEQTEKHVNEVNRI